MCLINSLQSNNNPLTLILVYYQIYDTSNQACPILSRNTLVAVPTDESDFTARLDTSRMRYPDNVSEIMTAIANNEDLQESYEAFRGRISVDRYSPPLPANGRIPWGVGSTVQAPLIFDIGGDITRERNSKGSGMLSPLLLLWLQILKC